MDRSSFRWILRTNLPHIRRFKKQIFIALSHPPSAALSPSLRSTNHRRQYHSKGCKYALFTIKALLCASSAFVCNSSAQTVTSVGRSSSGSCFIGGVNKLTIPPFAIGQNKQLPRNIRMKFTKVDSTDDHKKEMQNLSLLSKEDQTQQHYDNQATQSTAISTKDNKKIGIINDLEDDFSIANLASCPERFASSLGMTPQQVSEALQVRKAASAALHERLTALPKELQTTTKPMRAEEIGKIKHEMICRHRYENFRNPFVCRKCWTHGPICVCSLFDRVGDSDASDKNSNAAKKHKSKLPKGVERVIIWTHHDEWGRTSNTGSLLPLGLEDCDMLMKGLKEHEEVMNELLNRKDLIPVVLWPGKSNASTEFSADGKLETSIVEKATTTIPDLLQQLTGISTESEGTNNSDTPRKIVLITIEGTWNNARKMANKLPPNVLRLDLGEKIAANISMLSSKSELLPPTSSSPSLLAPLRRQGKGKFGWASNVSTLEATIIALLELGLPRDDAHRIITCARSKVDRIREYTGKVYSRS